VNASCRGWSPDRSARRDLGSPWAACTTCTWPARPSHPGVRRIPARPACPALAEISRSPVALLRPGVVTARGGLLATWSPTASGASTGRAPRNDSPVQHGAGPYGPGFDSWAPRRRAAVPRLMPAAASWRATVSSRAQRRLGERRLGFARRRRQAGNASTDPVRRTSAAALLFPSVLAPCGLAVIDCARFRPQAPDRPPARICAQAARSHAHGRRPLDLLAMERPRGSPRGRGHRSRPLRPGSRPNPPELPRARSHPARRARATPAPLDRGAGRRRPRGFPAAREGGAAGAALGRGGDLDHAPHAPAP
jgi:hypothetical protein